MFIKDQILGRVHEFEVICELHNVKYLYAFGSSVTSEFVEKTSDIDLLTDSSIHNPYLRKSIDESKILIYDRRSQKVFI